MDFRRIEAIFLFVFFALNIFLGVSLVQSKQVNLATSKNDNTEIVSDIKADQIKLPKLSTTQPLGGYLASQATTTSPLRHQVSQLKEQTIRFAGTNNAVLHAALNTTVRVRHDHVVRFLNRWKQNPAHVINGKQYVYAPELSGGNSYVFAQKHGQHLLYDAQAELTFTIIDGTLNRYTQTYLPHLQLLRGNVSLCSAQDAVVTLYRDNELPANAKVLWTKLGYSSLLTAKGSTVYVPTWLIGVAAQSAKGVTVKRLNAITKTVMKATND